MSSPTSPSQQPQPQQPIYAPQQVAIPVQMGVIDPNLIILNDKANMVRNFGVILVVLGVIAVIGMIVGRNGSGYAIPVGLLLGAVSIRASQLKTIGWARANFYLFAAFFGLFMLAGLIFIIYVATIPCNDTSGDDLCAAARTILYVLIVIVFFVYAVVCLLPCAIQGHGLMHAIARRDGLEPGIILISPQVAIQPQLQQYPPQQQQYPQQQYPPQQQYIQQQQYPPQQMYGQQQQPQQMYYNQPNQVNSGQNN